MERRGKNPLQLRRQPATNVLLTFQVLLLGRNDHVFTLGRRGGVLACVFCLCGVLLLLGLGGFGKLCFVEEVLHLPVQGCNLQFNVFGKKDRPCGWGQLVLFCQSLILPQLKKIPNNTLSLVPNRQDQPCLLWVQHEMLAASLEEIISPALGLMTVYMATIYSGL